MTKFRIISIFLACWFQCCETRAQEPQDSFSITEIEAEIQRLMDKGDIPGMSVFMIKGNEEWVRNFGWRNVEAAQHVSSETLFQIGSCSKAFTALALQQLVSEGRVSMESKVTDYIPWFEVSFEEEQQTVTVEQLVHHTSGIPWQTISSIPVSDSPDALEETVRAINGTELREKPGEVYEYATVNYDILALIIQQVTGISFETYLQQEVINPLRLQDTTIGIASDSTKMAQGYRIGFYEARPYDAPVYRGNNAAGYITSNIDDMARWLKFQMGRLDANSLYGIAQKTHQRDETVAPHGLASYGAGWNVSLDGSGLIYHGGLNPNFTAFVGFRPEEQIGVVVLANSNSNFTRAIGDRLVKRLAEEEIERELDPGDGGDGTYSGISVALAFYLLLAFAYLVYVGYEIYKGKRRFKWQHLGRLLLFLRALLFIAPFLLGVYLIPEAISGFNWNAMIVWSPGSLEVFFTLLLIAVGFSYFVYLICLLLPTGEPYKSKIPLILLLSSLSGLANVVVVIMVTSFVNSDMELIYIVFYFGLTMGLYLLARRFVQISLITFTRNLVYDFTIRLVEKIFSTSYQKFEKIDRGRVYTALNDDVARVGESTSLFLGLVTNIITAVGVFVYLASIALWATLLTLGLILALATVYYFVSSRTNIYFERARDERNVFMSLISGLIDGYKELSLHLSKKLEYKGDVAGSAGAFRDRVITADVRFVNAYLVGEFLLVGLLGFVAFGIPRVFSNIEYYTVVSFVVVLLYLIGPINALLNSVPAIMRLRVSWNRIQTFLKEIPANLDITVAPKKRMSSIETIELRDVGFAYQPKGQEHVFSVGPINLQVQSGEILFIVGGNGSGKTTLAKLITGLYEPDEGGVLINRKPCKSHEVGEYFSTVFSSPYLFSKLYDVDALKLKQEVDEYLELLDLSHKVEIENNRYSTINLSGGQRKRLTLLQCYLEDSPIFLFDELAADQDPEYRKTFYRELLPRMKAMGKIVIAITHDDQYFDVADSIVRMNEGRLEPYTEFAI